MAGAAKTDTAASLYHWVNRHAWLAGCDLETEYRQAREEGRDLRSVEREFKRLLKVPVPKKDGRKQVLGEERDKRWLAAAGRLLDKVQKLPLRKGFAYDEPSDLEGIRAARPPQPEAPSWQGDHAAFLERLHGGLLGRIAGCMLGKPVEGWRRASIRINAEALGNWPLKDYWRAPTIEEQARIDAANPPNKVNPNRSGLLRGTMNGMVEDDDINYTTIGFAIVNRWGKDFTPFDVATAWLQDLPILHTCTAERVAYRNLCALVVPPRSAAHRNPYREWIGAQIRADYFGYANPGRPERAAQWAWRDACISHVKNGIYGEMWVAAMLAAAYVESDWITIIRAGLAQIPARCRLAADIEKVLRWHDEGVSYEDAVEKIHRQWDEDRGHDWCHTNSNAQIVVAALLYGEDDYTQTISKAVMPGLDTDCNGATAGSLWGVRHGVKAIPGHWAEPLRDLVRTGVHGHYEVPISRLAREMAQTAWNLL